VASLLAKLVAPSEVANAKKINHCLPKSVPILTPSFTNPGGVTPKVSTARGPKILALELTL
jgi:hypothetical protein